MTSPIDSAALPGLISQLQWAAFVLAFIFGAVAQRTHFCTMGAIADLVNFGDWTRMRQWLLAMAVAIALTTWMTASGVIDISKSLYTMPRFTWFSYMVGGLLFGMGMVLAGGCGSKTLIRVGNGSLKSLVVFLVIGISAFITLKGALGVFRVNAIDSVRITFNSAQDLPSLISVATGWSKLTLQVVVGSVLSVVLISFVVARRDFLTFDNLLAGLTAGAVVSAMWFVSGHLGYLTEHPETLEEAFLATNSGRMEALSYVAPIAYTLDWLMFFSDKSKFVTLGIATVFGLLAGSASYALVSGKFRWEGFRDTEDTANHLIGGVLMGFGGVTALGCTIGQGLSGVSTLALGSFVALIFIIIGAVVALRYQLWRQEKLMAS